MGGFADKIGIPLQKAWIGWPSPPCSSVGVLEPEERFIGCGFSLGDNSLIWLGAGTS